MNLHIIHDDFYKRFFGADEIHRADYESELGQYLNKEKVDVVLKKGKNIYLVSERDKNWDSGFELELYSDYPNKTSWLENTEVNFLVHFILFGNHLEYVCIINVSSLKKMCSFFRKLENWDDVLQSFKTLSDHKLLHKKIFGKNRRITLVRTHHRPSDISKEDLQ